MINLGYLFSFGKCGCYCLKYVFKKTISCKKRNMSLCEMSLLLKENGYDCFCCRVNEICDIFLECISLVKVNKSKLHYVVLKKIVGKYIYYYDPLFLFVRKKKIDVFVRKWSKICLFYTKV